MKRNLLPIALGIALMAGFFGDGVIKQGSAAEAVTAEDAWKLYNTRELEGAERAFSGLARSGDPATALEATLGLGYTRLKMDRLTGARDCFELLVRKRYKTAESLPILLDILIRLNEFAAMDMYLPLLKEEDRRQWNQKRSDARVWHLFREDINNKGRSLSPDKVARNLEGLGQCAAPDVYFQIAGFLVGTPDEELAVRILTGLLGCPGDSVFRFGLLSRLVSTRDSDRAEAALAAELSQSSARDSEYLKNLTDLYKRLLYSRLSALPEVSEERLTVAGKILSLDPEDLFANTILAWNALNSGDYTAAEMRFSELTARKPDDMDLVLGLGYSLYHQGKLDQAAERLAQAGVRDTPKILELKKFLFERIVDAAISAREWDRAGRFLALLEQTDTDGEFLALRKSRIAVAGGDPEVAMGILAAGFETRPSPALGTALLDAYQQGGFPGKAWRLALDMNASGNSDLVQAAARWLSDSQYPLTSAQVNNSSDACTFNADSIRLEFSGDYRHKSGEAGTSRLDETGISAGIVVPYALGRQWSIALADIHLSSGSTGATTAGSFYRYLNGDKPPSAAGKDLSVRRMSLDWRTEGPVGIQMCLGTSPLNGPVETTPALLISGEYDNWRLEVHRESVRDSILSFAGLDDPYGDESWGRVMKNGFSVGKTLSLGDDWWLSADGGIDAYRGKNVWKNNAWHLDMATGKTFLTRNRHELSAGLYAGGMGFDHNTDFYTFGHGGYYSPDLMVMAGPFTRFRTPACGDFRLDLQVSAGWMMEKTSDAPYYPLHYEVINDFTPPATKELHGIYSGDREDRLAYAGRLEGWKLLSKHVAVGCLASIQQSSNTSEWRIGFGIDVFFDPQKAFWKRDSLTSRPAPCCR